MGSRIFWAVVAGFLAGVFIRSFAPVALACAGFALVLSAAIVAISFFDARTRGAALVFAAALAFDPSFELSALATLGLILFAPVFDAWFRSVPARLGLREILSTTCAAQLAVLPLLLYQNGTLSLVALPSNALALFPVPWAMFASFAGAAGGMLFGSHAAAAALPAYFLLHYIIAVARLFAALPFAAVAVPAFPAWLMLGAYAALFFGFWATRGYSGKRRTTCSKDVAIARGRVRFQKKARRGPRFHHPDPASPSHRHSRLR